MCMVVNIYENINFTAGKLGIETIFHIPNTWFTKRNLVGDDPQNQ